MFIFIKNSLSKPLFFIPIIIGIFLSIHVSLIGLTDDEAYYWLLAQTPAWGYAYHPPIVAWCIWVSEQFFSFFGFYKHPFIVRAPAVLFTVFLIYFFIFWLKRSHLIFNHPNIKKPELQNIQDSHLLKGLLSFLTFAGIFGVSWMMVPDLPLVIGYMGLFLCTWAICFYPKKPKFIFLFLGLSAFFAILSKFTAIFAVLSSFLCVLYYARTQIKKTFLALFLGLVIGSIPILIWNYQNDWGAFLYHLQDRHQGGHFSWLRYSRFWLVTFIGAGPILFFYFLTLFKRIFSQDQKVKLFSRYIFLWVFPAALVFCVQPAFSDFKPHWVLLVIFPILLEFCFWVSQGKYKIQNKIHKTYGIILLLFIFTASHIPIASFIIEKVTNKDPDPRLDVTNDMYGWSGLYPFVIEKCGQKCIGIPILGSRYQTASQAAFVWQETKLASRIPRTKKEYHEFPEINQVAHQGPDWPELLSPVLFVADIRYHQPPEFMNGQCTSLGKHETTRWKYLAKWVEVYYCERIQIKNY